MVTNFKIEGLSHSVAEQIRLICQRNLGITNLVVTEQGGAKSANEQAFSVADSSFAAIWANPVAPLRPNSSSCKPPKPDVANTAVHHSGATSPVLAEILDEYEKSSAPRQTVNSSDRLSSESSLVPVQFERSPATNESAGSTDLLHTWQPAETALDVKVSAAIVDGSVTDEGIYDTWTDGPLTYFNVYLDEMPTHVGRSFDNPGFNLSKGMLGAGLVSAVAVSGLLIGDAFSKPNPPETRSADNSQVEQDPADKLTELPVTAAPERTQPELSPKAKEPEAASKPTAKNLKQPTSTPTQRISNQLLSIPSLPPPPLVSLNQAFPLAGKPTPATPTPKPFNLPPLIPTPTQQPAPAIATPEAFPPTSSTTPKAPSQAPVSNPTVTTPEVVPQATTPPATAPQPISRELPRSPQTSQAIPSLAPTLVTPPASSTETKTSRSAPPQNFAETPDTPPTTNRNSAPESKSETPASSNQGAANSATRTNTPQGIQDYLTLGQAKSIQSPTLMPLSSQAATEAANTDKIGSFTVKQVDAQAYQQEWQNSNPNTNDPAIALAFPAYGFIDYQRQLIVLLQDDKQAGIN
ncbi:MAG TPA: hypothetical protein IGS53_11650 [Leptolyngbyaceae cyanobacterium M33_DOE_097]|uniref:Uncharacterized protein n=1 Tax=Oscillatoriales cyanobacterium SpSt-418 TaxID=2282169 RepID=A0A7C3PG44_9CYAN|nr:hypothetical protein [Leptolyngbyaceae cyanobacterium M33_DOE_097]